jgi:hypothetical protein
LEIIGGVGARSNEASSPDISVTSENTSVFHMSNAQAGNLKQGDEICKIDGAKDVGLVVRLETDGVARPICFVRLSHMEPTRRKEEEDMLNRMDATVDGIQVIEACLSDVQLAQTKDEITAGMATTADGNHGIRLNVKTSPRYLARQLTSIKLGIAATLAFLEFDGEFCRMSVRNLQ